MADFVAGNQPGSGFFASGYGFLAGITYAAQASTRGFIWIFRSTCPMRQEKEAGLRNGLQMVLFSAMTGIGLCMAHRALFLFPRLHKYIGTNDG